MTRLESGTAAAAHRRRSNWPMSIGSALRACQQGPGGASRSRSMSQPNLPMLELDVVLFEQVLFNLLDNAAQVRAGRDRDPIKAMAGRRQRDGAGAGRGAGIPADDLEQCSTSSIAFAAPIGGVPGRGWGSRSAAVSSRRWAARIVASNRTDRSGAVFTVSCRCSPRPRGRRRRST